MTEEIRYSSPHSFGVLSVELLIPLEDRSLTSLRMVEGLYVVRSADDRSE